MRVIFLDFDGVILTDRAAFGRLPAPHGCRALDPVACGAIARVCRVNDIKIIVSSDWRYDPDKCNDILEAAGLLEFVVGATPPMSAELPRRVNQIVNTMERFSEVITEALAIDDALDVEEGEELPFEVIPTSTDDGMSYWEFRLLAEWARSPLDESL